jgi:hypothetical protein
MNQGVNGNKTNRATPSEQREFLLDSITWQESLLQSYRTVHTTIQGLLLTSGTTVLAVQITSASLIATIDLNKVAIVFISNLLLSSIIIFLFWIQFKASSELGKVIRERAKDVDFWHKELVKLEKEFPSEQRTLSTFKRMQQLRRANMEHIFGEKYKNNSIEDNEIDEIIKKGLDHTRNVLDNNLFKRLQLLWEMILLISICISIWVTFNIY